jgi:hypothetical protein
MRSFLLAAILVSVSAASACSQQAHPPLAPTPPMGWNSWDAFGTTIDERSFRASAQWIAQHLKPFGYQYVTIDEAWFDEAPPADGSDNPSKRSIDANGRLIPAPVRFPSAAGDKGFAPLADYIHSLGLKFGIHVLNGIPRLAVAANTPILDSAFTAQDAANTHSTCQWNNDNYDLKDNAAAQAYYDSIVRLYASWHVDLIKIDCIAAGPYKGEEIRMFHQAIVKSGAPIALSLSPGPAPLDEALNLRKYAQQWRISDDVWDVWHNASTVKTFPQGLNDQIANAAQWLLYAGDGHWPDLDMLPLGQLGPAPGWGQPRATRLTPDEQRTMINLWAILRSPLVYGGNPAETDAATLALLTNPAILAIDQHSRDNKSVLLTADLAVYTAKPAQGPGAYVAVFNRKDVPQEIDLKWSVIFQTPLTRLPYRIADLWTHAESAAPSLKLRLAPHASTILLVKWRADQPDQPVD